MKLKEFIKNLQDTNSTNQETKKTAFTNLYNLHTENCGLWYSLQNDLKNAFRDQEKIRRA